MLLCLCFRFTPLCPDPLFCIDAMRLMPSRAAATLAAAAWPSLALAVLVLLWSILARYRSETWWWVAILDLIPPQVILPPILWLLWRTRRSIWLLFNLAFATLFVVFQVGLIIHFGSAPARESASMFTLLSLNAHYASAPPPRLAEIAAREGVDMIALQEAQNRQGEGAVYEASVRAAFPGWALVRAGQLLTLSRLPIENSHLVHFANPEHGVLSVQIGTPGQGLTIVNAHLPTLALRPTQGEPDGFFERVAARLAERRAVPDVLAGIIRRAPGAVLLAGDLNAPAHGQMHSLLHRTGLQDAFAGMGQGFGFTYHQRFGFARLDYVWGSGVRFEDVSVLPDALSDHRALLVRFQWR